MRYAYNRGYRDGYNARTYDMNQYGMTEEKSEAYHEGYTQGVEDLRSNDPDRT